MNKELEELKGITRNKIEYIKKQPKIDWIYLKYYEGVLDLIAKMEAIDNAEPSEALKDLKKIKLGIRSSVFCSLNDRERFINNKEFNTIEQALLKIQEQEKALKEIIKLINDIEPTFNRKQMSSDTNILGTIIKNYFFDNASETTLSYLLTEENGEQNEKKS